MSLEKPYADIPGTTIFDADMARKGHHLNQFCLSLMKQENRDEFNQHESLYLDKWPMSEEQKQAVISRDYNAMIAVGGNIYYLAKLFSNDGLSFQQVAATITGMSELDYVQMMLDCGRDPQGNLYLLEEKINGTD